MKDRQDLSFPKINDDLLDFPLKTPLWFWPVAAILGMLVGLAVLTVFVMALVGLQILGYTNTQEWGVLITNFVFWVGISHAGVMISAILRLTQAEWRRPVTRAAEVMTMFSLMTAMTFPFIHTGRQWRTAYWAIPYDFWRGIFPNPRSALIMDPSAIFTYLTGTILFIYITTIPDIALLRDRTTGWRHRLYRMLALGWQGGERQWMVQAISGFLLAALM